MMSNSNSNTRVIFAATGVLAITLAALVYFGTRDKVKVKEEQKKAPESIKVNLEREGLLKPKLTKNKYCLDPEYLIELLNFIGVMAHEKDPEKVQEIN